MIRICLIVSASQYGAVARVIQMIQPMTVVIIALVTEVAEYWKKARRKEGIKGPAGRNVQST
jgi:hypothetical protein